MEWETLKWVDWYNNTRPHSAIGYVRWDEGRGASGSSIFLRDG
ncbi:transposase [Gluconacetobacter sacchari]|uniref:Transposase n=1 Tax=Gluconacetobacter sacchari TaxID=92759 RepID=A0A7W4IFH5_9PROT|nr:transposase [Gluconacetobacter sacchari]